MINQVLLLDRVSIMNVDLNRYLSLVLRNEVKHFPQENLKSSPPKFLDQIHDQNINKFIVDRKYSLRLDEII